MRGRERRKYAMKLPARLRSDAMVLIAPSLRVDDVGALSAEGWRAVAAPGDDVDLTPWRDAYAATRLSAETGANVREADERPLVQELAKPTIVTAQEPVLDSADEAEPETEEPDEADDQAEASTDDGLDEDGLKSIHAQVADRRRVEFGHD